MILTLTRVYLKAETPGLLVLNGRRDYFVTYELPWKGNQNDVSCIPEGVYRWIKHDSGRFGRCVWILDVPGRTEVLIHYGNTLKDTEGCILLGRSFYSGKPGLAPNTREVLNQLVAQLPMAGEIEIVSSTGMPEFSAEDLH